MKPLLLMKKQLLIAVLSLAVFTARADEGMWMLTDLQAQNAAVMRELGLEIPIEEVYSPNGIALKDAVVHFGGVVPVKLFRQKVWY